MDIYKPLAGCYNTSIVAMLMQETTEGSSGWDVVTVGEQLIVQVETTAMAAYIWQDGLGESLFVRSTTGYTIRALRQLSEGYEQGDVACPMIDIRNIAPGEVGEALNIESNTDGSVVHLCSWNGSAWIDTHFRPNGDCDLAGIFKPLGGYKSSDGSAGIDQSCTLYNSTGGWSTLNFKDGILVSVT